jgi:putative resolvase
MDEENPQKFIPIREVYKLTGIKPQTIRKWSNNNKLKVYKTPTGQTLYDKTFIENLTRNFSNDKKEKQIIYCRVSSQKQKDDLVRQSNTLLSKFPNYELITDIGSGINWKRKGLKTILEHSMRGNLKELVVAHKDRLCRFAFELIEWIVESNGGKITVLDEDTFVTEETELAEDVLSIIHIFSCKQMGKRRYKNVENKNLSN